MAKTLLKTDLCPDCNRNLNNNLVKCELCETSLYKTCAKLTQHQYNIMLICRKHIVYQSPSCCEVFPFQNISDDECIFEHFSVDNFFYIHTLVDKCSHFNVNLFKYSDDKRLVSKMTLTQTTILQQQKCIKM